MKKGQVLSFLNLKENSQIDKSLMKIALWFDFAFTFVIIAFGFLLKCIDLSWYSTVMVSLLILVNIFLFILYIKLQNPAQQFSYTLIVLVSSCVKLFYGYLIFANGEHIKYGRPYFTIAHGIVLILSVFLSVYVLCKFFKTYSNLTKSFYNNKVKSIRKMSKWLLIISSCSPMIFVRLFRPTFLEWGLGVNFAFWILACVWFSMIYMLLPKCIVVKKFKVKEWFNTNGQLK